MRRIPRGLLPHQVRITPVMGESATGPVWAEQPGAPVDAAVWPTSGIRTVTLDGAEYQPAARLFTDEDPGIRSKVTGGPLGTDTLWVVRVLPWSGGGVAYTEAYLAPAPADA